MNELKQAELDQFTDTANYYRDISGIRYTDGVKYMAEKGGAYWLITLIGSYKREEPFQVWELKVFDGKGVVTMKEDTDEPELVHQKIKLTDFPMTKIKLYLIDGVLLLPSEY